MLFYIIYNELVVCVSGGAVSGYGLSERPVLDTASHGIIRVPTGKD